MATRTEEEEKEIEEVLGGYDLEVVMVVVVVVEGWVMAGVGRG